MTGTQSCLTEGRKGPERVPPGSFQIKNTDSEIYIENKAIDEMSIITACRKFPF